MKRRDFNQLIALGTLGLAYSSPTYNKKISLAQWSLHRTIKIKKELSPNDFSIKAREMGFDAVEYVSSLYWNELKSRSIAKITKELVSKSNDNDIKNLLIMVDGEGDLAAKNNYKREKAIENHVKWIEILLLTINNLNLTRNKMILKLKDGEVEIELYPKLAPNHVKRFETFAKEGKYDGVVFHRVIDGFMAQTGDVKYGNSNSPDYNLDLAGTGGSELPNLKAGSSSVSSFTGSSSSTVIVIIGLPSTTIVIVFDSALDVVKHNTRAVININVLNFLTKLKKVMALMVQYQIQIKLSVLNLNNFFKWH